MISRDDLGQTWTTTYFVGLNVETMPGFVLKGVRLSHTFACPHTVEAAHKHIQQTFPQATVFHETICGDDHHSAHYRQAVDNDLQVTRIESAKVAAISARIQQEAYS